MSSGTPRRGIGSRRWKRGGCGDRSGGPAGDTGSPCGAVWWWVLLALLVVVCVGAWSLWNPRRRVQELCHSLDRAVDFAPRPSG
jgi:hypothetical protein